MPTNNTPESNELNVFTVKLTNTLVFNYVNNADKCLFKMYVGSTLEFLYT